MNKKRFLHSDDIGLPILKALGITANDEGITSVVLRVKVGALPRMSITKYIKDEHGHVSASLGTATARYELVLKQGAKA